MNPSSSAQPFARPFERQFPLLTLLNPGRLAPVVAVALALGLAAGWSAAHVLGFPFWTITAIVLLALLPVGVIKWREDLRRYGATIMLLSIILASQGAHTFAHITQWVEYYLLFMPARQYTGLLSPAN